MNTTRSSNPKTPTGSQPTAQGCEARATLGNEPTPPSTLKGLRNNPSALQTVKPSRAFRKKLVLRSLGVPVNARWEHVAPIIKQKIIHARRANDDTLAALLSEIKAWLKRCLYRTCTLCGSPCYPGTIGKKCQLCFNFARRGVSRRRALPATILCLILGIAMPSHAASVDLGWNQNAEPDIAGYQLHYKTVLGTTNFTTVDVGAATQATIGNLLTSTTYEFYATAYNTSGLESAPSSTVAYTVPADPPTPTPAPPPPPPCTYILSAASYTFSAGGGNGSVRVTTDSGCSWSITGVPAWLTGIGTLARSGPDVVMFTVGPNPTTVQRTANLTIAGRAYTITQAPAKKRGPKR